VYCVNDGAVMQAWAEDQGVDKSDLITMMGDPSSSLTAALNMGLDHPGPQGKGLFNRCKRFSMLLVDGTIKIWKVAEGPDDPAGDDYPDVTLAPSMISAIKELSLKDEV
jgi:peroxiredoxin